MFKIINNEGIVISQHNTIKEAEARVEMFKSFLPNQTFRIESDEPTIQPEQPKELEQPELTNQSQNDDQPTDELLVDALKNIKLTPSDDDINNDIVENNQETQENTLESNETTVGGVITNQEPIKAVKTKKKTKKEIIADMVIELFNELMKLNEK